MFISQDEQGFSSFFTKFLVYLMIFQKFRSTLDVIHFEKSSNNAKNLTKNVEKHFQNAKDTRSHGMPDPSLLTAENLK